MFRETGRSEWERFQRRSSPWIVSSRSPGEPFFSLLSSRSLPVVNVSIVHRLDSACFYLIFFPFVFASRLPLPETTQTTGRKKKYLRIDVEDSSFSLQFRDALGPFERIRFKRSFRKEILSKKKKTRKLETVGKFQKWIYSSTLARTEI